MSREDGIDANHNKGGVPFTYAKSTLPKGAFEMVECATKALQVKEDWQEFVRNYPEKLEDDKAKYGTALAASVPVSIVWLVAWLVFIGAAYATSLPTAILGGLFVAVPMVLLAFCVTTTVHAMRYRQRRNPVSKAIEQAWQDVASWTGIALVFPFYAFPKFGFAALEAFVASPRPIPEDAEAAALKHLRDSRIQVAIALDATITRANLLAGLLKAELASRALNKRTAASSNVDVDGLRRLLRQLREEIDSQVDYLTTTYGDGSVGEYTADVGDLLADSQMQSRLADEILASDDNRRAAILELSRM